MNVEENAWTYRCMQQAEVAATCSSSVLLSSDHLQKPGVILLTAGRLASDSTCAHTDGCVQAHI